MARGLRPIEHLDAVGALAPTTLLAHATMTTPEELIRLRDTGASFVLCDVDDDRPLPSSKLRRLTMRNERSGSGTLVPVVAIPVETGDPAAIAFPAALHPAHPPRTNDVDALNLATAEGEKVAQTEAAIVESVNKYCQGG